jgi:hypothetical protein
MEMMIVQEYDVKFLPGLQFQGVQQLMVML